MQDMETYRQMLEHLRFFFVSSLFNPTVWLLWAGVYAFAWVVGRTMRHSRIGSVLIILTIFAALGGFVFRSQGWDLLILGGLPFVLGLYVGKK